MGSGWLCSLNRATWQKFTKQKLQSIHDLAGITNFGTQNPDLEEPGPHALLELWSIIFLSVAAVNQFHLCLIILI
jgi:hypothetical protein